MLWDICGLIRDAPCLISCSYHGNRHKTVGGFLFQELLCFPLDTAWASNVYNTLSQVMPHWAASCKRDHDFALNLVASFIQWLSFQSLCPTISALGAVHQYCMSAVCWGKAAFVSLCCSWMLIGLLLCNQICPLESGSTTCVHCLGVMRLVPWQDQLWAALFPLCFKKSVTHLKQKGFSFSHAFQHSQERKKGKS